MGNSTKLFWTQCDNLYWELNGRIEFGRRRLRGGRLGVRHLFVLHQHNIRKDNQIRDTTICFNFIWYPRFSARGLHSAKPMDAPNCERGRNANFRMWFCQSQKLWNDLNNIKTCQLLTIITLSSMSFIRRTCLFSLVWILRHSHTHIKRYVLTRKSTKNFL